VGCKAISADWQAILEGLATPDLRHRFSRRALPRRLIQQLLSKGRAEQAAEQAAESLLLTQFQTGPQAVFRFWQICPVHPAELEQATTAARAQIQQTPQFPEPAAAAAHRLRLAPRGLVELAGARLAAEAEAHR
jgi:hypothetical protein